MKLVNSSKGRRKFSSHSPVLKFIGKIFSVKKIIEFGCGIHSTTLFLNQKYFPDLKILYSYETNQDWLNYVNKIHFKNKRLELSKISENTEHLKNIKYDYPCDLVFIDGDEKQRDYILKNLNYLGTIFVRHDGPKTGFDNYEDSWKQYYKYVHIYNGKRPSTVIFSNQIDVKKFIQIN